MEKGYNKAGEIVWYEIANGIRISNNYDDPSNWYLSIKSLNIWDKCLCKKTCTEEEIARYVMLELVKVGNSVARLKSEVSSLTSKVQAA